MHFDIILDMKLLSTLFVTATAVAVLASCNEKKETTDIIAHKPAVKKTSMPQRMQSYNHREDVSWIGKTYKIEINRMSDTALPVIADGSGNKFYDNRIMLKVLRDDGSEFFSRTFSKTDFSRYVDEDYMHKSALLGLVLEKAEENNLYFAASIGSPDVLSDEYVPLRVTLSRTGGVTISKSQSLELSESPEDDDSDGV